LSVFAPLPLKIAPEGAIPPTLRNAGLYYEPMFESSEIVYQSSYWNRANNCCSHTASPRNLELGRKRVPATQVSSSNIDQCGPTTGPRVAYGQQQRYQWPAEAFGKNPQIWKLLKSVWGYICLTELLALDKAHLHKNNE